MNKYDWKKFKENNSLEDFYNILCRNKPHHKSKLFDKWCMLESICYEELLNEEKSNICDGLIDDIIEFLKKQKSSIIDLLGGVNNE